MALHDGWRVRSDRRFHEAHISSPRPIVRHAHRRETRHNDLTHIYFQKDPVSCGSCQRGHSGRHSCCCCCCWLGCCLLGCACGWGSMCLSVSLSLSLFFSLCLCLSLSLSVSLCLSLSYTHITCRSSVRVGHAADAHAACCDSANRLMSVVRSCLLLLLWSHVWVEV